MLCAAVRCWVSYGGWGCYAQNRALKQAAYSGHINLVEAAAKACDELGVNIDSDYSRTPLPGTALALAVQAGHADIVDWLVEQGASVGAGNPAPIVLAALRGESALLLKLMAVESADGKSAREWLREHPTQRVQAIMSFVASQEPTDDATAVELLDKLEQGLQPGSNWLFELHGELPPSHDAPSAGIHRRRGVHMGACGSSPCENGGTCVEDTNVSSVAEYWCICTGEWSGLHCTEASAELLAVRALDVLVGGGAKGSGLDRMWGATPWQGGSPVTPLMATAFHGWVGGVRLLLSRGASTDLRAADQDQDALSYAVQGMQSGTTPLPTAAVVATLLLDHGAQPRSSTWTGAHGRAEREKLIGALRPATRSKLTSALRGVSVPRTPPPPSLHKRVRGYHPPSKRRPFRDDL